MEKLRFTSLVLGFLFFVSCQAFSYSNPKLPINKAEKLWGSVEKFDPQKFREGDRKVRASMAVDLVRSKVYVGKPLKQVRKDLGTPTGYYYNDGIPAYILTRTEDKDKEGEIWQVVFIPDKEWENVRAVEIRKN